MRTYHFQDSNGYNGILSLSIISLSLICISFPLFALLSFVSIFEISGIAGLTFAPRPLIHIDDIKYVLAGYELIRAIRAMRASGRCERVYCSYRMCWSERCSGSYCQAVIFLVIKDDWISEREGVWEWRSCYTAHARRNLPVKEYCYLRTFRGTWQPPSRITIIYIS